MIPTDSTATGLTDGQHESGIAGTATEEVGGGIRLLIRPNHSLTPVATLMFMGGFSILTLAVAIVFVLQGYWPVLPFAGLEIAIVGAAFWYCGRKAQDYDLITIEENRVSVVQRVDAREHSFEFDRHWARVELVPGDGRFHAPRLMLGSHGERVEIGRALPAENRELLASRMRRWLRRPTVNGLDNGNKDGRKNGREQNEQSTGSA